MTETFSEEHKKACRKAYRDEVRGTDGNETGEGMEEVLPASDEERGEASGTSEPRRDSMESGFEGRCVCLETDEPTLKDSGTR